MLGLLRELGRGRERVRGCGSQMGVMRVRMDVVLMMLLLLLLLLLLLVLVHRGACCKVLLLLMLLLLVLLLLLLVLVQIARCLNTGTCGGGGRVVNCSWAGSGTGLLMVH